ncbi:MAG: YceI family protein [Chitinophagaceae bacterium]|nr:YceI family protein [Chitinophagaceae bacterium]
MDTAASTVIWTGTKPSGKHVGAVSISQGTLELKKKNIKSGNFTINMSSITDTDLQGKSNSSLVGHLKSADFFDVEKFPTAVFELTGISELEAGKEVILDSATHTVSGNFTMKGIKQNISFPANITVTGSQVRAKANFNLDRTLWGVNYGTANGKVSNDINLKLDITANK